MSERLPALNEERLRSLPPAAGPTSLKSRLQFQWPAFDWAARNSEISALVIGFVVALCFVPQILSFQHRNDPVRANHNLPGRAFLEELEYHLYDERFSRRGPQQPESQSKIAIVAVDQQSLLRIAQWPWPRSLHAILIRRLKRAGAKVIALDFDFSDRQLPNPNGTLSAGDLDFIAAAKDSGNVILPSLFNPIVTDNGLGKQTFTLQLTSPFSADGQNPGLDEQTADVSLAYLPTDSDGGYRRYPFVGTVAGANMGGFATLACGLYQGLVVPSREKEGWTWKAGYYEAAIKQGSWPDAGGRPMAIPLRAATFPGKDPATFSQMLINYWGSGGSFATYPYADCLDQYSDADMKKRFGGRIVFVGATAIILKDLFPFPVFQGRSKTDKYESNQIAGVEIHATAAAMLLDGKYIQPPNSTTMWWTLFGLSMFSAVWTEIVRERVSQASRYIQERWHKRRRFKRLHVRVQDITWFGLYGFVSLIPAYVYWNLCVYAFVEYRHWVVAAYPLVSSAISSGLVLVFLFTLESAERRKVIHQVGLYMDEDILEEILAHPEEEYPRARRTVGTVMFTDLEGFTPYAEAHDADEVVAALNLFMTRMSPIVRRYGGSVDKYIGDAIMAYFGVPLPRHDHAERALICAIEMQEECVRFRDETGIPFRMRVGIHTGELIAGSVGSEGTEIDRPHLNYTVIGDTVNVAARLEGKNKEFGSWIMISRSTHEAAPGVAEVIPAMASIKGKSQDVEVFIVRGFQGEEPRDIVWAELGAAAVNAALMEEAERTQLEGGEDEFDLTALPGGEDEPELTALSGGEPEPEMLALSAGEGTEGQDDFPAPGD